MKINLLPEDERPLKQSQVRWEFLVGLIAILALGASVVFSWLETGQVTALTQTYAEALAREALLMKQVQTVEQLRKDVNALEAQLNSLEDLRATRHAELALLPSLVEHSLPQLWIEALAWNSTRVDIAGYTRDMTSLSSYLNQLNERSEEAVLSYVQPVEGTDFIVFGLEVKGVRDHGAAALH